MIKAEEILNLIELKQEGSYWDFKKQWYEDGHEGDLLHDIICMANNLVNREAYIIIGVDEEKDYCAYDVDNDSHRRTTQNLVDFLRDKKFAGDVRPLVTVEPCKICERLEKITVTVRVYCDFYCDFLLMHYFLVKLPSSLP